MPWYKLSMAVLFIYLAITLCVLFYRPDFVNVCESRVSRFVADDLHHGDLDVHEHGRHREVDIPTACDRRLRLLVLRYLLARAARSRKAPLSPLSAHLLFFG